MNNKPYLTLAMGIAVVVVLTACVTAPAENDFAPTWPEELPVANVASGSIYQSGHDVALFENAVARRVGDTVTINLVESTAAQKSSSTSTSKSSKVDIPGPTLFGGPVTINGREVFSTEIETDREFDGSGDSQLSNKLRGNITVTVAERLANGNLVVRGQKWIGINQGSEFIRIQGVIRPIDIQSDNTIPSFKVADASISYGGKGALAEANAPGLLSRFFNSIWFPL